MHFHKSMMYIGAGLAGKSDSFSNPVKVRERRIFMIFFNYARGSGVSFHFEQILIFISTIENCLNGK
ncbi:hypothetical protein HMPREF3213_03130 [Heyndrickxia coagulans]|uniref:Uncharacterized protein n=1 Tax=Heyndrickxia coagulans TaxID=1398 RepID=A0A133KEP8_HEYCO|nr:hypothetical protein HMPREF3213_03130 [Heyndrickxia coagulans]